MEFIIKYKELFLLVLISLIPLLPLLSPGLPVTHDGQDHVARIANFYTSLTEGNLIPRWAGNLNWGYGHPILMFLYPLPSYVASFFHFLGLSLVDSVKLLFATTYILSGIAMYLWLREFLGRAGGIVGAMLYLFAPYRFIDLYVRGAIGEHVAFVFPPLILYFIYKIFSSKNILINTAGLAFSMAGLLLAHNAISIMFLPFVVFYGLLLYIQKKDIKKLLFSTLAVFYAVLLSAFFVIPAFIEGKYTLRDIVTGKEVLNRFVDFPDLLYGPWSYGGTGDFSVQVGILQWIFVFATPFVIYKLLKNKELLLFSLVTFAYFLGSIFIMLPISEFVWVAFSTLQKFQFPWRFLSVSIFAASILGAIFVSTLKNKPIKKGVVFFVIFFSLVLTFTYWKPKDFQTKESTFYSGIYESTTDTGESAPIWSVRFMEKKPTANAEIVNGSGEITSISRKSNYHLYNIEVTKDSKILENTLYFPGWKVYIDGVENKNIEFQNPAYRGLMTYDIAQGNHNVEVVFEETKLRYIANGVSLISFCALIGMLILARFINVKQ